MTSVIQNIAVEQKRNSLRYVLSVISIVVGTIYIILDYINRIEGGNVLYFLILIGGGVAMYLNFNRHNYASNVVLLTSINIVIFLSVEADKQGVGSEVFFVCSTITAISLMGVKYMRSALFFILVSLLLYLIAFWFDFDFVPARKVAENQLGFYRLFNLIVALVTSALIVNFLLQLNHRAEKKLQAQTAILEKSNSDIEIKNNELIQINKELDHFVYSVSHDLRAPLSSIMGLINLYELSKQSGEENCDQLIGLMKGRIAKLDGFIKDILDHSRNSRTALIKEEVLLVDLVNEVLDSLNYVKGFDQVTIEKELIEGLILIDKERFKIVLNNILTNAIKYTDTNKPLKWIKIKICMEDGNLLLEVEDNGKGIEANHIPFIFDMFYRGTNESDGSGLGLYIVKEVVTKMNGGIDLKSELGSGTRVSISIPC